MPSKRKVKAMLVFGFFSSLIADAEETLPAVPASVLKRQETPGDPPVVEGSEITMRPGVSVVAPIAYGHLNRIVTPFNNPQVRTVSKAQIQVHDRVVYLATEEETPITLFITPNGKESPALPLILAPRKIPPREIRLKLEDAEEKALRLQEIASDPPSDKNLPHVAHVKSIMKDLANGRVPAGFVMRDPLPEDQVQCFQDGLKTRVGQVMEGPGMVLRVAVLSNSESYEVELDEARCTAPEELVAVAAWPRVRLSPGEAAELFILSRKEEMPPELVRPSLLEGG